MVTGRTPTQRPIDLDTTIQEQPSQRTAPSQESLLSEAVCKLVDHTTKNDNHAYFKPVSIQSQTFDGKNEKFELYEDWFHTYLRMQPNMTETMKINHFHAHVHSHSTRSANYTRGHTSNFSPEICQTTGSCIIKT